MGHADSRAGRPAKRWREQCFQRDRALKARCWRCKQEIDYTLKQGNSADPNEPYVPEAYEADHEKSWHSHPALRYVVSNGKPSHAKCNRRAGALKGAEEDPNDWITAEDWD